MDNIKVIAFDCDGVLFDTKKANLIYYNAIMKHMGRDPLTRKQYEYAYIHTVENVLRSLFEDEESYNKAQAFRETIDYASFIECMEIEPYLKTLLTRLKPKFHTAVVTNRTNTIYWLLKEYGLTKYFDYVVCALDVKRPKPAPDLLLKLIDLFDIKPRQAVYIGDSKLDEEAARVVGIPFISYCNELLDSDFYITSLSEVENIIEL